MWATCLEPNEAPIMDLSIFLREAGLRLLEEEDA